MRVLDAGAVRAPAAAGEDSYQLAQATRGMGGEAPHLKTTKLRAGEKRLPPMGKFVAAGGEKPMAIDTGWAVWQRRISLLFGGFARRSPCCRSRCLHRWS